MTAAVAAMATSLFAPSTAHAQPGAPPPPPPPGGGGGYYATPPPPIHAPYWQRRGLTIGFGFGVGGMSAESGPIECAGCDYDPAAGGFDFHIGGMISPRLALVFEIWGTAQALESSGRTMLVQTMAMVGLQYWLTRQLWIKGGVGAANLSVSYDDGRGGDSEDIDTGGAIMGAIGYEIMSSRRFAIDLQLRVGSGTYSGIDDQINAATFGVGFNWF